MIPSLRLTFALSALLLSTLACAAFTPDALITSPSGTIIFESDKNGNVELYSIRMPSGTTRRLTNNTAEDTVPFYNQFTNQIGFISDRDNGWNIYVMDVQGNNVQALTDQTDVSLNTPSWHPDGEIIVASRAEDCKITSVSCTHDIFTLDAAGNVISQLTFTSAADWNPVWSPDGSLIAFSSDQDGDFEIYTIAADGSNLIQLTDNENYDGRPRWSPDGTRLVFETDRDGEDWDIYLMAADGSNQIAVTHNYTHDFNPDWSPDGNWLVYITISGGNRDLVLSDPNGENQRRLTRDVSIESSPIWIP